jgi:hypothetical protein
VRVEGQLVFNMTRQMRQMLTAALAGYGRPRVEVTSCLIGQPGGLIARAATTVGPSPGDSP